MVIQRETFIQVAGFSISTFGAFAENFVVVILGILLIFLNHSLMFNELGQKIDKLENKLVYQIELSNVWSEINELKKDSLK